MNYVLTITVFIFLEYFAYNNVLSDSRILLYEGDNCTVPETKKDGQCIDINKCEYVKELIKEHKPLPPICGFIKDGPLVCCPLVLGVKTPGILSTKMCDQYHNVDLQPLAIDLGQKALVKEFPHMAAIGYEETNANVLWLCGGSLISRKFVLTAAHCVKSKDFGPAKWVRLGDLDLKNTTEDARPFDLGISESYRHPEWRPPSHYHDIALLRLSQEVNFGLYFKPACLHTTSDMSARSLEATGWGQLGILGDSSSHLMKVNLTVVDYSTCSKKYKNISKRKLPRGIQDNIQICAGNYEGGDTCPGDSGGPLHYLNSGSIRTRILPHFVVVGVTSFGKGCGGENSAGVYTRVSTYVEWIEKMIWEKDQYN